MRILFVTTQLGRGYVHGTERYLGSLAEGLRARGHEVVFLAGDPQATDPPPPFGSEVDPAQSIHAYPTLGWTSVQGHSPAAVERWMRALGPDVVHVASLAEIGSATTDAEGEYARALPAGDYSVVLAGGTRASIERVRTRVVDAALELNLVRSL